MIQTRTFTAHRSDYDQPADYQASYDPTEDLAIVQISHPSPGSYTRLTYQGFEHCLLEWSFPSNQGSLKIPTDVFFELPTLTAIAHLMLDRSLFSSVTIFETLPVAELFPKAKSSSKLD